MPSLSPVGRSMISARDYTPRVGGSEGAFIAIIVVLGLVFIGACIGIYVLLHYWEPSERERAARRRYSIRRRGLAHPLPIGMHDPNDHSADAPGNGTLTEKLGNMFRGRRHGSGWQQTADDDDWEADDEQMLDHRPERASVGTAPKPKRGTVVEPDGVFNYEGHASPMQFTSPARTPAADMDYANPFETPVSRTPSAKFPEPSITPPPQSRGAGYIQGMNTRFKEDI